MWRSLPLYMIVYEELQRLTRLRGANTVRDDELYNAVREAARMRGFDVSYADFLKALMVLEMQSLVYVHSATDKSEKGKIIELVK